jgi:hypothetical protein
LLHLDRALVRRERFGDGIVLEHQQGVEERLSGAPRPALHCAEGRVLVLAQLGDGAL